MLRPFSLHGKNTVLTGGGGVLVSALAEAFLDAGATVYLLDLDEDRAAAAAERMQKDRPGAAVRPLACDVLNTPSLEGALEQVLIAAKGIHVLVNGAGGNHPSATTRPEEGISFFDLPEEGFRRVFDLNLEGTVKACRVFGRAMAEQGSGSIINIASLSGLTPLTKVPAYSAAKAAVLNFTRWLAVDMARNFSPRVRVNALVPGFFHTKQNHFLLYHEEVAKAEALTERGRRILEHTPAGRFGRGEDLAGAAVWLASDASAFVSGTAVVVDGGFSAYAGV